MGTLIYGNTLQFEFDDRTLDHVKTVVFAKLRRRESFSLTWTQQGSGAKGPVSVWISPEIPLGFQLSGEVQADLSREWIDALMKLSYTNRGLVVIPERAAGAQHAGAE